MGREYEWDEGKYFENLKKHGVDFVDAILIFEGETLAMTDSRRDYGEERYKSIGLVDADCFVVIHTEREGAIRLISAWKGGRSDRNRYDAYVAGRSKGTA
ncbi:MAG: BrnT family toxin [Hyphomonadaceae bacterium]|jgi:hypothetical protein|nr:BrnT family toxin [Hyphomonadaceae bacterium]